MGEFRTASQKGAVMHYVIVSTRVPMVGLESYSTQYAVAKSLENSQQYELISPWYASRIEAEGYLDELLRGYYIEAWEEGGYVIQEIKFYGSEAVRQPSGEVWRFETVDLAVSFLCGLTARSPRPLTWSEAVDTVKSVHSTQELTEAPEALDLEELSAEEPRTTYIYHYPPASGVVYADNMQEARAQAARLMGTMVSEPGLIVNELKPVTLP